MDGEAIFYQAIAVDWDDDLDKLKYSDYLEESGANEFAQALRWLVEKQRLPFKDTTAFDDENWIISYAYDWRKDSRFHVKAELPENVIQIMPHEHYKWYAEGSSVSRQDLAFRSYHTKAEAFIRAIVGVAKVGVENL